MLVINLLIFWRLLKFMKSLICGMTMSLILIEFEIKMKICLFANFISSFLVFILIVLFLNLVLWFDLKNFITWPSVLLYNFINFRLSPGFLIFLYLFQKVNFQFLILNFLSIKLFFQVKWLFVKVKIIFLRTFKQWFLRLSVEVLS